MTFTETADHVYSVVAREIRRITGGSEPTRRAALAKLRRGAGKPPGSIPYIWEMTIGALSDDILYRDDRDRAEWAVHIALTLFATQKQGADNTVSGIAGGSFGTAVATLCNPDNRESITRRFNAAVMSDTVEQLSVHARSLTGMLKGGGSDFDYPRFAKDLYYWQFDPEKTRLNWGRDYWRNNSNKQEDSTDE
jgi:CRISPR type I-E/ECOLI-associated protein CasB/Cse2